MAKFYYQGHGSFRIIGDSGVVIYVDPYVGDGYDIPADLILVTHQHHDHNHIELCAQKPTCRIISNVEALEGGAHQSFHIADISIEATLAQNKNHDPALCVGYILSLDGISLYASGDTSTTEQMKTFAERRLDYAILCGDGIYNMNPAEAADCARLIGARHNILIHMKPRELFDPVIAESWDAPNKLIVRPGEEIAL